MIERSGSLRAAQTDDKIMVVRPEPLSNKVKVKIIQIINGLISLH